MLAAESVRFFQVSGTHGATVDITACDSLAALGEFLRFHGPNPERLAVEWFPNGMMVANDPAAGVRYVVREIQVHMVTRPPPLRVVKKGELRVVKKVD
jgi:hypothetical protein